MGALLIMKRNNSKREWEQGNKTNCAKTNF